MNALLYEYIISLHFFFLFQCHSYTNSFLNYYLFLCLGEKGIAYTLVTDKDKEFAGHLVRNLEGANQAVPQALMDLAMQVFDCIKELGIK